MSCQLKIEGSLSVLLSVCLALCLSISLSVCRGWGGGGGRGSPREKMMITLASWHGENILISEMTVCTRDRSLWSDMTTNMTWIVRR